MINLDIRKTIIDALLMRLQAQILDSVAGIEACLRNPELYDNVQDSIRQHLEDISQCEIQLSSLNKYFVQTPAAPAPPSPQPTSTDAEPIKGEELSKRSPTYRKSLKDSKSAAKPKAKAKGAKSNDKG